MNDYYENLRKIEQSLRQTGRTTAMLKRAVEHVRLHEGNIAVIVMRDQQELMHAQKLCLTVLGVGIETANCIDTRNLRFCTPETYGREVLGRGDGTLVFIDHAVPTEELLTIAWNEHMRSLRGVEARAGQWRCNDCWQVLQAPNSGHQCPGLRTGKDGMPEHYCRGAADAHGVDRTEMWTCPACGFAYDELGDGGPVSPA